MKKKASELFRKLGMTVNLTQPMRNMSVSQRQMCEIAKAISYNSQVIVLDEPTSSLTVQEVDKLFEMMRMLKAVSYTHLDVYKRQVHPVAHGDAGHIVAGCDGLLRQPAALRT